MKQVRCYYCSVDIYLFQATPQEIKHHGLDGQPVQEEIHLCYWCALREEGMGDDAK